MRRNPDFFKRYIHLSVFTSALAVHAYIIMVAITSFFAACTAAGNFSDESKLYNATTQKYADWYRVFNGISLSGIQPSHGGVAMRDCIGGGGCGECSRRRWPTDRRQTGLYTWWHHLLLAAVIWVDAQPYCCIEQHSAAPRELHGSFSRLSPYLWTNAVFISRRSVRLETATDGGEGGGAGVGAHAPWSQLKLSEGSWTLRFVVLR